jgi:hypothetical protein
VARVNISARAHASFLLTSFNIGVAQKNPRPYGDTLAFPETVMSAVTAHG